VKKNLSMELTKTPDIDPPPFTFVSRDFDAADVDQLESIAGKLLERPIESAAALRQWIYDWSEVGAMVSSEWARRLTAMNRDTRDEEAKRRHLTFQGEVMPRWQVLDDKLDRHYLASPFRKELGEEFAVFDRVKEQSARLFREENTRLGAEDRALGARYQEMRGSMAVEFRGETLTMQQCMAKLQEQDRALREEAFLAASERTYAAREKTDELFDEMLGLRARMAANAGFDNFLDFQFARLFRFDYTTRDCTRFQDAVEKVVVPALVKLRDRRCKRLGLETLRPWDRQVSLFGVAPRDLFRDQQGYVELVERIFGAVDPRFAADFDILVRNGLLDLMSRPGKAPGGYNCPVDDIGLPFIFYNAVGRRGDLRVLLHEGGHAFHTIATRGMPVKAYRRAPTEFAEVASMSMEMFGFERLGEILEPDELREVTYGQFSGALHVFASVALVDAFQAWIYTHPGHSREERTAKWLELADRFTARIDWTGVEKYHEGAWQAIPHLFLQPLYYIEYGIAQLGALQLWLLERNDHEAAVAGYRRALALGGSRPLPELFETAGIRFAMDEEVLRALVPAILEVIEAL